jgi:cutinase
MNAVKGIQAKHRRLAGLLGIAMLTAWATLLGAPALFASAEPCPDVEVVFARGTGEPPGVGGVGQGFVDALRTQVGSRSLSVYPVNYLASNDFGAGMQFATTVIDGIRDAGTHVQSTAANCPKTRVVLGGYSQGAVVAGFVTSAVIPEGVPAALVPAPLPTEVANHVAAVILFGKPSDRWMTDAGAPPVVIGPAYAGKTLDLCAPDDTICNGAPLGGPSLAHGLYLMNGMTNQAATFAVSHL